ncbi:LPS export ABC transporter permease LptF [Pseudodonghicola xiamenensis]|uniref:LPS export ABC transporter permease LptF n=1 Tax=Pseudodonghicola xiamenensis TaxID=337702 RepID=A0A8J3H6X3_9RHOB|nr:LPS export ABC transporter permease LptF [Pseudodonghicola xiamenensis]GHG94271.1 LPS export ABC transporter permease LptF [Pseudodonghicola xiamenensis]
MSRFDGYVLRQLLVLFGFFLLVLVGVLWISRSVSLFDRLISGGQSAMVFLEFTALSLPTLIRTVMPMAAFGAAVYATNRLSRDSELTVMLATGSSPLRLARPMLYFGVVTALMMAVLTTYLRPASIQQLGLREAEVTRDLTAQLLNEGSFMHPTSGVTFYIGKIDPDGTLHDVFLSDRRDQLRPITYTAARAFLVSTDDQLSLVMVQGMAMRYNSKLKSLSTTLFADFSYDITSLASARSGGKRNLRGVPTTELFSRSGRAALLATGNYDTGEITEELHERLAWIVIVITVPLVGYAAMMMGGFSRFGLWPQALTAFAILLLLEGLRGLATSVVLNHPQLWWLLYLPAGIGLTFSALMLRGSGRPLRLYLHSTRHTRRNA